jgi:AraC-like DNA-binding protein
MLSALAAASEVLGYTFRGMLHKDLLIRLCEARDLLRQTDDNLPIRCVAREVGMSPYHFIRLFKAVFGETPKQCQLQARLEKAKYLLMLTDSSVTNICMEAGFSSLGTFTYVFTRRVGMPPTIYRQKMRSMMTRSGEIPDELVPGCFSLMCSR